MQGPRLLIEEALTHLDNVDEANSMKRAEDKEEIDPAKVELALASRELSTALLLLNPLGQNLRETLDDLVRPQTEIMCGETEQQQQEKEGGGP